ncbi:hypothetical protein V6N11_031310 [Hibiscus sabdariffa]|uniref:Uncharacterized protein n=1 Tax=Hibiscus sabdariffa TaxID=183260 RepID=A0ABR2SX91_9ROSI
MTLQMNKSDQNSNETVSDFDDENVYNSSQFTLSTLIFDLRKSLERVLLAATLKNHFTDTILNVELKALLDHCDMFMNNEVLQATILWRIDFRHVKRQWNLKVIVDLGASMISKVEVDVSTNRRPDLSSLICEHLGVELIVLNSACPFYDIVFGLKVTTDINDVAGSFLKYYESPKKRFVSETVDEMLKCDAL